MANLWSTLIGSPLPTRMMHNERLDKVRALAALSPDALSSIAYANQEIYLGLIAAGTGALAYSMPIAIAIGILLAILTLSYSQTIAAYPNGGGSYTVASENLGRLPGLVAAAALLTDYVLTAAVSLTAGVAALASAFPSLWEHRALIALILLAIITIANLRGLREAGTLIAVPVYLFLGTYLFMIAYGLVRAAIEGPSPAVAPPGIEMGQTLTVFLILHTFSSGCTALTGVEAISNGVTVFRPPETRNARQTMAIMAVLMGVLLLGSIGLTQFFGITAGPEETILSALTRHIFGSGFFYYLIQFSTLFILVVAANTSFVDFPRVVSLIARDGYLPRPLSNLGDRLVFSNGIWLLAALTGLLIAAFGGDSHALIPLFAVGVFLAFTLSQAGMVVHWLRLRGRHWQTKAAINGLGAVTTAVTFIVVAISKFREGAWIIAVIIPFMIFGFTFIARHYQHIARQLTLQDVRLPKEPPKPPRVVVPISGVHKGVLSALRFACSISDNVTALYIETDPDQTERFRQRWEEWGGDIPLEIVESPYRSILGPLLEYLDRIDADNADGQYTALVLPQFIPAHWWENFLHNQTAWMINIAILYQRRRHGSTRVVIDVPFHLKE
jgi:amino acid transporter